MSGQLHAPAALFPRKEVPVPTQGGYRSLSGYTLKQIWNTNGTELLFLFLNILNRKRIGQMFTYKDCTNLDTF